MTPTPTSAGGSHRNASDTKITCSEEDEAINGESATKVKGSGNGEEIPLNRIGSGSDEDIEKIRRIFTTGCSCVESMRKMWTQLQLLEGSVPIPIISKPEEDELDGPMPIDRRRSVIGAGIYDRVDHVASTTELISATLKSRQCVPNKDVQKEASILRKHWGSLVQKIPNEDSLLLCRAIQKKPLILEPFLEMLSGCICFNEPSGNPNEGQEDETTINMDMKDLLECPGDQPYEFREAQVLLHLVEEIKDMEVKDRILAHPLITTFATLKYQKYRFVSILLLVYHLLFAALFTHFAFHVFLSGHPVRLDTFASQLSSAILTLMAFLSSIKTVTTFFASGLQFDLTTTRRIGEIFCAFIAFFMCLLPSFGYSYPFERLSVNKDIAAFGVMTSWLVLLSYLTKFNQTAVYVQTFFQVVKNYIQFLWMVALCQLIALAASYSLIFHKEEPGFMLTGNLSRSFIRVLTGRMNYDDYAGEKENFENPLSVFNYFFLFFVLSTVMMGMIIGLAQNSLQDTRSACAVNVLCQVIKDIAELEWIIWRLTSFFPRKVKVWLVSRISIRDSLIKETVLAIRPHDQLDKKIPGSLKKSIYTHLMERGSTCHNKLPNSSIHF